MKRHISARVIGAAGLTAVLLLVGACSGSDDAKDDEKKDDTSQETTTTAPEATELSDEEFSAGLGEFAAAMEAAGDDICKMGEAQALVPQAPPANEAQMKETITVYTDMLRSYATAVADDAETAATLNSTADELDKAAEEAGYPKDFLTPANPEDAPAILTSPEYQKASEAMAARFSAECPQAGASDPAADPSTSEAPTTVAP